MNDIIRHFVRSTCLTAHKRKHLISQSHDMTCLSMLILSRQPAEVEIKHHNDEVTLTLGDFECVMVFSGRQTGLSISHLLGWLITG